MRVAEIKTPNLKVDAVYGDTKSTKTSRLGDAAEYWAAKTGKPAKGVFCDTGSYDSIRGLEDDGILVPFVLTMDRGDRLLDDIVKLTQGWWPRDPKDPTSPLQPPDFDKVSCYLFDSGTSLCEMMMAFHESSIKVIKDENQQDVMVPTNVKVPEMPKDSFIKSGDLAFRFVGRSDYMGVQGLITRCVKNTAYMPVPAVWSFGEAKGADEFSKPCYGPDFIGNKLTGKCGKWFGNLLHLDLLATEQEVQVGNRKIKTIKATPYLFTAAHIDPDDPSRLPYMAGTRVDKRLWEKMPAVLEPRLDKFYELIDKLEAEAKGMKKV